MADELQKIQNIVSGGDLSSAKPATAAKGRSRSRALAAPTVQLEYNPTHKYHLRVTKKEEAKTMKALKAKNITVQVLANLKVGTLFLTNKVR